MNQNPIFPIVQYTTASSLKQALHLALEPIAQFEQCALLNYPNYGNIGDHLIGLGSVLCLLETFKIKIPYLASLRSFSAPQMESAIGPGAIFLQGGGNLGDLWYEHQQFREDIIQNYRDRPIVILPQSIYFQNHGCLKRAVNIFNSHPNLTLFAREKVSYNFAREHFDKCNVYLAPDMAFHLANLQMLECQIHPTHKCLYLKRKDKEQNQNFYLPSTQNLVVEDWIAYKEKWLLEDVVEEWIERRYKMKLSGLLSILIRRLSKLYREGWQRGVKSPQEFFLRLNWIRKTVRDLNLDEIREDNLLHLSLSLLYSGVYQFKQYETIITNRLHGHILCILLDIPHYLLINSYHKNMSFYETWTNSIRSCNLIKDPEDLTSVLLSTLHHEKS